MTLEDAPAASVRRGRGRPRGATSAVVREVRALGLHHVAFLRACLLGMDARDAFERYVAFGETSTDLRHVQACRRDWTARLLAAARRLDATLPDGQRLTRELALLHGPHDDARLAALPSLDDWIASQGLDPEMWGEAELLAEYRAAHGLADAADDDVRPGPDPVRARVQALNVVAQRVAAAPRPDDGLEAWFAAPVARRLRQAGLGTVAALLAFVNVHGFRWHGRVAGIGAQRGARIVAWLAAQAEALGLPLREGLDEPRSRRQLRLGAREVLRAPSAGIVPLERLVLPAALLGRDGVFRSPGPNTLDARDDLQAVTRWLSRYGERPATLRSYRKEVERFVLWCAGVSGKPVSSVSALDCQAYRAFLQRVPAPWINALPVERDDPAWRPFRGQLTPSSQKQALVVVQAMFEGLRDAGYLLANPMRAVMKSFALPTSRIAIERSFTEAEWSHVQACVDEVGDAPARGRLRCVLALLVSSGVRLDELGKARRGDLRLETLPGLPPTWVLSVTGKRSKTRDVPLADAVVDLLDAHALDATGAASPPMPDWPLVFALRASVPQWRLVDGQPIAVPSSGAGGALSSAGIAGLLKRFFIRVASSAERAGLSSARLRAASTHWTRHTFARQALVDGAPLEVVSELLGHASLDTTSIYAKQELARKIATVRGLRHSS